MNTFPFVIYDEGIWRMYYVAGVEWVNKDLPRYNIQYVDSDDGLEWRRDGHVCIDFASPDEALARPYVLKEGGVDKKWFAHKGADCRFGYAKSLDVKHWTRRDDFVGLTVSADGFDRDMVEYPCVFKHDGHAYLLYNGNNYGFAGTDWAVAVVRAR